MHQKLVSHDLLLPRVMTSTRRLNSTQKFGVFLKRCFMLPGVQGLICMFMRSNSDVYFSFTSRKVNFCHCIATTHNLSQRLASFPSTNLLIPCTSPQVVATTLASCFATYVIPPPQLAAMALSPVAALSLQVAQNPSWQESFLSVGDKLREAVRSVLDTEAFLKWSKKLDESVTFMEWSYNLTGVDLSYVWDPELWVRFKEAIWQDNPGLFWNKFIDRIQYKNVIPQAGIVGDMRISYSKFLQLLESNRVKRVVVYGDMKTAIVEVPHPWYSSVVGAPGVYPFLEDNNHNPLSLLQPNPLAPEDPTQWFCPEMPEWNMEKYRFYVDLPGDFWESGQLVRYLRSKDVQVVYDINSGQYLRPYSALTKVFEVRTEVQVLDPAESWDFLGWITAPAKLEFYEKAAAVCIGARLLTMSIVWLVNSPLFRVAEKKVKKKQSKEEGMWQRLTASKAQEFMTKDKKGKVKDTGVRFADIAGMDDLVLEMREIVKMLLKDPAYVKIGAKPPRGFVFQGPPGTGKTYLARALAGEAGVPFFSAVGSEFVEMYQGIAAARVNNLFKNARDKAPCIIFIDEIDAIGRARQIGSGDDPGASERESALLAMLVQMDGIHGQLESVVTIGATNLVQELDQALLRPGRFEIVYEITNPGPVGRLEMLRYHSRNKKLADDTMLKKVAEATQGWSAAALANLMNEAAILTVRRNTDRITLDMVLELVEHQNFGEKHKKLPPSEAKNRLAIITAAKAVAFALTPGLEPIDFVTLWSQRQGAGPFVEFIQSMNNLEDNVHPEEVDIMDHKTNFKVNAASVGDEKLGEFLHVASLLIPFYSGRAAELAFFGPDQVSLATAPPIHDCFELAYYCVRNSMLHPRFRRMPPLATYLMMGENAARLNQRDPLAIGLDEELGYHKLVLTLLKASWKRTQQLVAQRRTAIVKVAEEMLAAPDERVNGKRLVEIIETTPLDDASDITVDAEFLPILKEVLGRVPNVVLQGAEQADAVAVQPQQQQDPVDVEVAPSATVAAASFRDSSALGAAGQVSFSRPAPSAQSSSPSDAPPPPLVLDDDALKTVSRAIMGRTDIVDLVGRNTAYEVAERVRDALLDPQTTERLKSVRKWVEDPSAPFPLEPSAGEVPLPMYGVVGTSLEHWKQRRIDVITWNAVDMLYTPRQLEYYKEDMDVPRFEDTSLGKAAAEKAKQSNQEPGISDASSP